MPNIKINHGSSKAVHGNKSYHDQEHLLYSRLDSIVRNYVDIIIKQKIEELFNSHSDINYSNDQLLSRVAKTLIGSFFK